MRGPALLVILLASGLATTATAEQPDMSGGAGAAVAFDDVGAATLTTSVALVGPDAADLRRAADQNADGDVTAAEAQALREEMNDPAEAPPWDGSLIIALDDAMPSAVTYESFHVDGLVGPTTATTPVVHTTRGTVTWDVEAGKRHTLAYPGGGTASGDAEDLSFVLTAPDGYRITEHQGLRDATLEDGDRTVRGDATGEDGIFVMQAGILGGLLRSVPASGLAVAVVVLAGMALGAERRGGGRHP